MSTLLLDKTGTITYGNRMAAEFLPAGGVDEREPWPRSCCCRRWPTRRPRAARSSTLAETRYGLTPVDMPGAELVPFTAQTRMSGIEWQGRSIRKGAADSVQRWVSEPGRTGSRRPGPDRRAHRERRRHAARRRRGHIDRSA